MQTSRATVLALVLLILAPLVDAQSQRKLLLVSWDGAPDWLIDRLLDEGKLPGVARLVREGVRAESMIAGFPSKTAVGHAAIFTGCWGITNGITGNLLPVLPRSSHTILETTSGFSSWSLRAEPIYVAAAKAGRRVAVLSATQSFPPEAHLATLKAAGTTNGSLLSFSGFEGLVAPHSMIRTEALKPANDAWTKLPPHKGKLLEAEIKVAESRFFALVYDDPADPVKGYDTVLIRQGDRDAAAATATATLKPKPASDDPTPWSGPFRVKRANLGGNTFLRLFALSPDAKSFELYVRAVHAIQGAAPQQEFLAYLEAYEGFHDDNFGAYSLGQLGPTLWQGGNGDAERRVLEGVRFDVAERIRGVRYALDKWHPDVLLHYTPTTDSAGHVWMGIIDPKSPSHDPALAAKIWPYYSQVFQLEDMWLSAMMEMAGPEMTVALVSDHGMQGVDRFFNPNAVLAKAGLYTESKNGGPDLTKTKILSPRWSDFGLVINGTDWKDGIVPPGEREDVLARAAEALLSARDPANGRAIVTAVLPSATLGEMGLGGPAGSDLYIDVANGYYPTPASSTEVVTRGRSPVGSGEHGFFPQRREMHAIFYVAGPGIAKGKMLPPVRQIDIFPTLAHYLGIPAPPTVSGQVLGGVFAP